MRMGGACEVGRKYLIRHKEGNKTKPVPELGVSPNVRSALRISFALPTLYPFLFYCQAQALVETEAVCPFHGSWHVVDAYEVFVKEMGD